MPTDHQRVDPEQDSRCASIAMRFSRKSARAVRKDARRRRLKHSRSRSYAPRTTGAEGHGQPQTASAHRRLQHRAPRRERHQGLGATPPRRPSSSCAGGVRGGEEALDNGVSSTSVKTCSVPYKRDRSRRRRSARACPARVPGPLEQATDEHPADAERRPDQAGHRVARRVGEHTARWSDLAETRRQRGGRVGREQQRVV